MRRSWPVARLISFTSSKNVNISRKSFSTVIVKQSSGMKDEYGTMDSSGNSFIFKNFQLESGKILQEAEVRYNCFGTLNAQKDNLVIVCHALTGNSRVDQWWSALLGPGKPLDTDKYMIVCANVLGSCYGSTGPQSIDPATGKAYGNKFPSVSIRDTVRLHGSMVREGLGVQSVFSVIGGSMGGMQALEWCALASEGGPSVRSAVVIGCGARHTAWQIAVSETQRQAIYSDPKWNGGNVDMSDPPTAGLSVARQIAMVSYRTPLGYSSKFGRRTDDKGRWEVTKYLSYQGTKFVGRFDPVTYVKLTEKMDLHDLGRGRNATAEEVLARLSSRVLVMGIDSDMLYPLVEQEHLAANIPDSILRVIYSPDGHDGFLLEQDQVSKHINELLDTLSTKIS